ALHNYHDQFKVFPYRQGGNAATDVSSFYDVASGLVHLLPQMDQAPLFTQMMSQAATNPGLRPWDNNPIFRTDIPGLICPSDVLATNNSGRNNYRFCQGPWGKRNRYGVDVASWGGERPILGIFGAISRIGISDVLDGTSNTIAMSERCQGQALIRNEVIGGVGIPATTWNDGYVDPKSPASTADLDTMERDCRATVVNGVYTNSKTNELPGDRFADGGNYFVGFSTLMTPNSPSCIGDNWDRNHMIISATSRHTGIVHVLMADGAVKPASSNIDKALWRGLGTRANNETIGDF
ncbi:MAG: hypothetical protein B7Z55_09885, partial [Planctomycetales bacterium 12-60-4]